MTSSMRNTVIVNILDKDYQVSCPPEQQAELAQSAQHLDHQMRSIRETGKVIGLERIAVMAALNISHDLLKKNNNGGEIENLGKLTDKIDEALGEFRQLEIG